MCAFKHAFNEFLHSFNEQCEHLTILFHRLDDAHYLHAIKAYETQMLVVMNGYIYVFSV